MLKKLPKEFKIFVQNEIKIYTLLAVIEHKGPCENQMTSQDTLLSCLRYHKTWIQYDMLKKKEKKGENYKTKPQILIYVCNVECA